MSSILIGLTVLAGVLILEYLAWTTHWAVGIFVTLLFAAVLTKALGL